MEGRTFLAGAATGIGLFYLLDPDNGRRRRSLLRDRAAHASHAARRSAAASWRDVANRSRGLAAATRARVLQGTVDDDVLLARVRSRLGRATGHARSIEVDVADGQVTLRGPVLARDWSRVLASVARVRGASAVHDELDVHESPEHVPGLQGISRGDDIRTGRRYLPPMAQVAVAAGLTAAGMYLAARRAA